MFVAVVCDLGSEEHLESVQRTLLQYGLKKAQAGVFESVTISGDAMVRLKKELDRLTDGYDSLRIYQYPMEGTLVVSSLKDNKWRKVVVSSRTAG